MNRNEVIEKALNEDVDLSREEYAAKKARADEITAAHGVDGEAPLTEAEREMRMRMNFYGSTLNIMMALLGAVDDLANRITTLNNNIVQLAGGDVNVGDGNTGTGD